MLSKEAFYALTALYDGSLGRAACPADRERRDALQDPSCFSSLIACGLVEPESLRLTAAGLAALEPYRVDNAVILAAGTSPRFVPLSLERPKGLYEVKGERLIERQIRQLQEAGITDITLVVGYKKEMFFYLREKFGVKLIFNDSFNLKSNIESLYLARETLGNTYVCVSDSYFPDNPFEQFEYRSFNAGLAVAEALNEMYVDTDAEGRIIRMEEHRDAGRVLLGHSFWQEDFSAAFLDLAEADREPGRYNGAFWEWLVKDNLDRLPPIYFKEYDAGSIYEFDSLDELRKFDAQYVDHSHSEILRNIRLVFRCEEDEIANFRRINEGLTNVSFVFRIDGRDYIYRHPGEGSEEMINRRNEKNSLKLAKQIGVDPTYIYADVDEGWKISVYVPQFREPDYRSFSDSRRILKLLRKLHGSGIQVSYGLRPWEDAAALEALLRQRAPDRYPSFDALKQRIGLLYQCTLGDGVEPCFCHGDTYKHNWMITPEDEVYLIDWEYAGFSDPGVDVGYYIVDAMYDFDEARAFIREYLGDACNEKTLFHFMAYTAIIAYYWFVWAMVRESSGAYVGDALDNWREMAVRYSDYLLGT